MAYETTIKFAMDGDVQLYHCNNIVFCLHGSSEGGGRGVPSQYMSASPIVISKTCKYVIGTCFMLDISCDKINYTYVLSLAICFGTRCGYLCTYNIIDRV